VAPTLVVADVETTANWFGEALGFRTWSVLRGHGPGDDDVPDGPDHVHTGPVDFCFVGRDDLSILVRRAIDGRTHTNADHSEHALDGYFWVTDVDELYARCRDVGTITEPLALQFYGVRDFTLRTPDGLSLCFGESVTP
jgi:uncharacterized glyoxalase superfamily protein PhnB